MGSKCSSIFRKSCKPCCLHCTDGPWRQIYGYGSLFRRSFDAWFLNTNQEDFSSSKLLDFRVLRRWPKDGIDWLRFTCRKSSWVQAKTYHCRHLLVSQRSGLQTIQRDLWLSWCLPYGRHVPREWSMCSWRSSRPVRVRWHSHLNDSQSPQRTKRRYYLH